ncbi:MAG: T9SS type A sorting domain-containing protein [Candidatus Cloacimonetes bacterium]|nr:T9SS type A sorting domain-containing protein [Candidatus Cloacimonadota bacterium]
MYPTESEVSHCEFGSSFDQLGTALVFESDVEPDLKWCQFYGFCIGLRVKDETIVKNCTFSDNGIGISCKNGRIYLVNCILYGNDFRQMYFEADNGPVTIPPGYHSRYLYIFATDLEGGPGAIYVHETIYNFVVYEAGSWDYDPLFIDAGVNNYGLMEESNCIDAGVAQLYYNDMWLVNMEAGDFWGTYPDLGALESHYGVMADFCADSLSGVLPFAVQFTDESYGEVEEWEWDFENDGVIDSYEQNPLWIFEQIGNFAVKLHVVQGEYESTEIKNNYITVANNDNMWEIPSEISSIQMAIDLCAAGDTLILSPGTYIENLVIDEKGLILASEYFMNGDESVISETVITSPEIDQTLLTIDDCEEQEVVICGLHFITGDGINGGGISVKSSSPGLEQIIIENCEAFRGGGLYFDDAGGSARNITIRNCTAWRGGGIWLNDSSVAMADLEMCGNTGDYSGGIELRDSELSLERALIYENFSGDEGIIVNDGGILLLEKSTLFEPENNTQCGIYCAGDGNLAIVNSIISTGIGTPAQGTGAEDIFIASSCLPAGEAGIVQEAGGLLTWYEGNLEMQPGFAEAEFNRGMLRENSPCVDAGSVYLEYQDIIYADHSLEEYWGTAPDIGYWELGMDTQQDEDELPEVNTMRIYPNPFNPETTIEYSLMQAGQVDLKIYNIRGQRVKTLFGGNREAGNYHQVWKGDNDRGEAVSSGIYFLLLKIDDKEVFSSKLSLIK